MKIGELHYIRIITYELLEEDPLEKVMNRITGNEKINKIIYDIKEVPISFHKDGRLSRTTSWHIKEAHEMAKNSKFEVEIIFDW